MVKKKIFLCLFLLFLSLLPCGSYARVERAYTIYESELSRLEQNLETLDRNNESNQKLLAKQKEQLNAAEKELQIANDLIKKSQLQNEKTQKSLQSAEISLERYEKEVAHKIKVKARQRNMWIFISAGLGVLALR